MKSSFRLATVIGLSLAAVSFVFLKYQNTNIANPGVLNFPSSRLPASLGEQVKTLDPKKKTVCTITINSRDEKDIFLNILGTRSFNFIELVPEDSTGTVAWFANACQSGVKCDILLVSGHFGGRFFGKSDASLDLDELEKNACEPGCDGLLKNPREVFLFGCNTLAGKEKDRRTMQEYVNVLVKDGFQLNEAERIAAFRYSPVGSTNESRMRRAFKGATKLYGFDSIAPLGANIRNLLKNYLKSVGDYNRHLQNLSRDRINKPLANALKSTSFAESSGWGDVRQAPACYLNSKNITTTQKVQWIRDSLVDSKLALQYSYVIESYLREMADKNTSWNSQERGFFAEITGMKATKKIFEDLLVREIKGMLAIQVSLANLMKTLEWWNPHQYQETTLRLIKPLLQTGIRRDQVDQLCSLKLQTNFHMNDLPPRPWSSSLIEAIGCINSSDIAVVNEITAIAQNSGDLGSRIKAVEALGTMGKSNGLIQNILLNLLRTEKEDRLLDIVSRALGHVHVINNEIFYRLLEIMKMPGGYQSQSRAAEVFYYLRPEDLGVQQALVDFMASPNSDIDQLTKLRTGSSLAQMKPQTVSIHQSLVDIIIRHPDYSIQYAAADILMQAPLKDETLIWKLINEALKGKVLSARIAALKVLEVIQPLAPEMRQAVMAASKQETEHVAIELFQNLLSKPQ